MDQLSPLHQLIHKTITTDLTDLVQTYVNSRMSKTAFIHELVTHLKHVEINLGAQLDQYMRTIQFEKARVFYEKYLLLEKQITSYFPFLPSDTLQQEMMPMMKKGNVEPVKENDHEKKNIAEIHENEESLLYSALNTKEAES